MKNCIFIISFLYIITIQTTDSVKKEEIITLVKKTTEINTPVKTDNIVVLKSNTPIILEGIEPIDEGSDEDTQLFEPEYNKDNTLRHLVINNMVNGVLTLSKLTLLGVASVTGTNDYPLTTLCALEIATTLVKARQQYLTQKLEKRNSIEKNESTLGKLVAKNTINLAYNVLSTVISFGVAVANPQANNVFTNIVLTGPITVAGNDWTNCIDDHRKYKKIKNRDKTLL